MPALFARSPGTVVRINLPTTGGLIPLTITTGILDIRAPSRVGSRLIVTQASLQDTVNYQLTTTMNEAIYAYVFGDNLGELRLSGLAFAGTCDSGSQSHGLVQLLNSYRQFKLSQTGRSVLVQLGTHLPLRTLLVGLQTEVSDPTTQLAQWSLSFRHMPAQR